MVGGRGRAWRPEKKINQRKSRSRKIALLVALLVFLVGFLLIPPFLHHPGLHIAILAPGHRSHSIAGFPLTVHSAAIRNTESLKPLFEKLHELNPVRVKPLTVVSEFTKLGSAVGSDDKLLLYCGLEPVIRYDENRSSAVVRLIGKDNEEIDFLLFLEELKSLPARQVIVMMDFAVRDTGFSSGRLSHDEVHLIEDAVAKVRASKVAVICACSDGQRNWEYVPDVVDDPSDVRPSESVDNAFNAPPVYSGTVFGYYMQQAVLEGQLGSVEELSTYLRRNVSEWVLSHHGARQTVKLLSGSTGSLSDELLVLVDWPEAQDLEPAVPDDQDSSEGDDVSETEIEANPDDADRQLPTNLERLAELQQQLEPVALRAMATAPVRWMDLNAALRSAQSALLHGDETSFRKSCGVADAHLRYITDMLDRVMDDDSTREFSPWIRSPALADEGEDQSDQETFIGAFDLLSSEEEPESLPAALRTDRLRPRFAEFVVMRLNQAAETIDSRTPEDQLAAMQQYVRFVQRLELFTRNWPRDQWPQEFLTLDEVLNRKPAWTVTSAQSVIRSLDRLLTLRHDALALATGRRTLQQPIRHDVWAPLQDQIIDLLTQLTEAERWLDVGPAGLQMADRALTDASSRLTVLTEEINQQQMLISVRDRQRAELPVLLQFLAHRQESVPLSDRELDAAIRTVEAILESESHETLADLFPQGARTDDLMSRHVQAMFHLTRDFRDHSVNADDSGHLIALWDYAHDRVLAAEDGLERRRMMLLPEPSGHGFSERRAGLVSRMSESGRPIESGANRHSGIWLSFWSIRLLNGVTARTYDDLWSEWIRLVDAVRAGPEQRIKAAAVRAQLAALLRDAWQKEHDSALAEGTQSTSESIFVSRDHAERIITSDLERRFQAGSGNRRVYSALHERFGGRSAKNVIGRISFPELEDPNGWTMSDRNSVSLRFSGEGDSVYIHAEGMTLDNVDADRTSDWFRLRDPSQVSELRLSSVNRLLSSRPVTIVVTDSDDVVLATQQIVIHPNAAAEWELEFSHGKVPGEHRLTLVDDVLELLPTTLATDGKHVPTSLHVRLRQVSGVARQADVIIRGYNTEGKESFATKQLVDVGTEGFVPLPLTQPASEGDGGGQSENMTETDVLNGLQFEITPVGLIGAETSTIRVGLRLESAEQYVVRPTGSLVRYDNVEQTLTVTLSPRLDVDALMPKTLPVQFHFSPELENVRNETAATLSKNLQGRQEFRFTFRDEIAELFQGSSEKRLEFGISVAGIPQAWRWEILESGVRELAGDVPQVRSELTLQNPNPDKGLPVEEIPRLIVGQDWKDALLKADMHILGGQFDGLASGWKLSLDLMPDKGEPHTVLRIDELTRRRNESIRLTSGPEGTWEFSTESAVWNLTDLKIKDYYSKGGRYELVARLQSRLDPTLVIEDRVKMVCDDTVPTIRFADVPDRCSVDEPLKGRIDVVDPESGVATIEVGLDAGKLRKIGTDGRFEFRPGSPGFPEIPRESRQSFERRVAATLFVRATNNAGLFTDPVREQDITFFAAAMEKPTKPAPVAPGSIVFDRSAISTSQFRVTLSGNGPPESKTSEKGKGSVVFDELPPGTYALKWKMLNSDFGGGERAGIRVKSGRQTPVTIE